MKHGGTWCCESGVEQAPANGTRRAGQKLCDLARFTHFASVLEKVDVDFDARPSTSRNSGHGVRSGTMRGIVGGMFAFIDELEHVVDIGT